MIIGLKNMIHFLNPQMHCLHLKMLRNANFHTRVYLGSQKTGIYSKGTLTKKQKYDKMLFLSSLYMLIIFFIVFFIHNILK